VEADRFPHASPPEVDPQLQEVQDPEAHRAHGSLGPGVCLVVVVAVPQPAEDLAQDRGAGQEPQQEPQVHEVSAAVEVHRGQHVQHHVGQEEQQTRHRESEVQPGILKDYWIWIWIWIALHGALGPNSCELWILMLLYVQRRIVGGLEPSTCRLVTGSLLTGGSVHFSYKPSFYFQPLRPRLRGGVCPTVLSGRVVKTSHMKQEVCNCAYKTIEWHMVILNHNEAIIIIIAIHDHLKNMYLHFRHLAELNCFIYQSRVKVKCVLLSHCTLLFIDLLGLMQCF